MKKILFAMLLAATSLVSCTEDEASTPGGIYGIVTVKETAEPMRATGVELYDGGPMMLLLKTVTYDDGHYEFEDLRPGRYTLRVVASGYKDTEYNVQVEPGRTARADMQLEKLETHLTVRTVGASVSRNKATLSGEYSNRSYNKYPTSEVGFIYSDSKEDIANGKKVPATKNSAFSAVIEDLSAGEWYVQAYARNSLGTEFGNIVSFKVDGLPTVRTLPATNISERTATLNGSVEYRGDPAYSEKGFVYSASYPKPTIDDPDDATIKVSVKGNSTEFSANISGLAEGSSYYARAYISNENGTTYGDAVEFAIGDYIILKNEGLMVQSSDISSGATYNNAIDLCKSSTVGGFTDWRLPTLGECAAMYNYRSKLNLPAYYYWTSDYYSYEQRYIFGFGTGKPDHDNVSSTLRVRCVRTLK